jgi:2-methylcitrate dehydratase PrpD
MSTSDQPGATRALVSRVRGIRYEELPDEALEVARHCLLDYLGVTLAGAREPLTEILVGEVALGEGSTQAGLIGRPERATRQTAALVNGAAGHALDFDDTHTGMGGHPTVPVLPALLALVEGSGASGRDVTGRELLAALVAGIELECRLGMLVGAGHYAAGFHATGTLGSFGAAAACAHLLGLDEAGWLSAMGLAGTQAAGLKSGFGTMAKPLHAGRAAAAGLLAATLARAGFTAQPAVLEVAQGFAATHACAEPTLAALERQPSHLLIRDTLFKYHAACYLTHAAIEAAAELRREHALDPEKITAVEIEVNPVLFGVCNILEPTTGLEGKFSLRATTALALLGEDTRDPATFSDTKLRESGLVALRDRIRVSAGDGFTSTRARVVVESHGERAEATLDTGVPAPDLRVQGERLRAKFALLAEPVLGAPGAKQLADAVGAAQDLELASELVRLACPR